MLTLSLDDFDEIGPLHPIGKTNRVSAPKFFAIPKFLEPIKEDLLPIGIREFVPFPPIPVFGQTGV